MPALAVVEIVEVASLVAPDRGILLADVRRLAVVEYGRASRVEDFAQDLVGAFVGRSSHGLRGSCWAMFRLLSSWRGPQAALKCSYCSDRVTRDWHVTFREESCTDGDAKGAEQAQIVKLTLKSAKTVPCRQ